MRVESSSCIHIMTGTHKGDVERDTNLVERVMSGEIEEARARARAQGDPPEVDDYGWGFVLSGDGPELNWGNADQPQ